MTNTKHNTPITGQAKQSFQLQPGLREGMVLLEDSIRKVLGRLSYWLLQMRRRLTL